MFTLSEPVRMSLKEHDTYFPYVDNFWVRHKTTKDTLKDGFYHEYYYCRFYRQKTHEPAAKGQDKQQRQKTSRVAIECSMQMRKTIFRTRHLYLFTLCGTLTIFGSRQSRHTSDFLVTPVATPLNVRVYFGDGINYPVAIYSTSISSIATSTTTRGTSLFTCGRTRASRSTRPLTGITSIETCTIILGASEAAAGSQRDTRRPHEQILRDGGGDGERHRGSP